MDLNKTFVIDIETKGLLEEIEGLETDLHVFGISFLDSSNSWQVKTTNKKV